VAAVVLGFGVPEVVLAAAYHGGQRGEGGDVAAQAAAVGGRFAVGAHDHGHGVPADVGADALFQFQVAGVRRLQARRNGVDVGRVGRERDVGARAARQVDQLLDQVMGARRAFTVHD